MKFFSAIILLLFSALLLADETLYQIQCADQAMTATQCQVDAMTTQGWDTFQTFCKKCHGEDALGTDEAPNLVESLAQMSQTEFLDHLLKQHPKQHQWDEKPQVKTQQEALWRYLRARADHVLPIGHLQLPDELVKPYQVVCNGKLRKSVRNPCRVDKVTFEGWRTFHAFCQGCHGKDVVGTTVAPHLLESIKTFSKQSFSEKMLNDYQVYHPWLEEHPVRGQIDELWAYLKARSDEALPINRPGRLNR